MCELQQRNQQEGRRNGQGGTSKRKGEINGQGGTRRIPQGKRKAFLGASDEHSCIPETPLRKTLDFALRQPLWNFLKVIVEQLRSI